MPVKCLFSGLVNLLRSSTWNYLRSVPVYLVLFLPDSCHVGVLVVFVFSTFLAFASRKCTVQGSYWKRKTLWYPKTSGVAITYQETKAIRQLDVGTRNLLVAGSIGAVFAESLGGGLISSQNVFRLRWWFITNVFQNREGSILKNV